MIKEMQESDFKAFWPIFSDIVDAQETYNFAADINERDAYNLWCVGPSKSYIFEQNNQILGSYYIKANALGPGDHVCNCGYMVAKHARGQGIARKMCEHSQLEAIKMGFKAMQFNSVVSTNATAILLWQKLGYKTIGILPKAYRHKKQGFVDSLIMYKEL
jgi:GNAT superfamily N-acetyltransferase